MDSLLQNLRYSVRSLRKNPVFTAVVVLTLALGIGANTGIFSVMHAVLLQRLPFRAADALFRVGHLRPDVDGPRASFSPQDFEDLEGSVRSFDSLAAYMYMPGLSGMNLLGVGAPARLATCAVSGGFFSTLGTNPEVGRPFLRDESVAGRDRVVVLSHRLWQTRFAGGRDVVGRRITLDDKAFEVIGVMPAAFEFPAADVDAWVPLSQITEDMIPHKRAIRWLAVVGRLRRGSTRAKALAELDAILGGLAQRFPDSNRDFSRSRIDPLSETILGKIRKPLWLLGYGVCLLLLVACVNVANLLIARSAERTREISIRIAVGATRAALWKQFLVESLLLVLLGGALGVLLATPAVRLLIRLAGDAIPRASEIGTSLPVLGYAAGICALAGIVFGTIPALRLSRSSSWFRADTKDPSAARHDGRGLQKSLVVLQTAFAVLLVAGASLLIRSFWRLAHVDSGIRAERVLTTSLTIPDSHLQTLEQIAAYREAILDRLRQLPGVTAVGASKTLPFRGGGEPYSFMTMSPSSRPIEVQPEAGAFIVTAGYFEALGIPVLRGRAFREDDMREKREIFIVNQALAHRIWGAADPIGATLSLGRGETAEVVGVVGNVKNDGLSQPDAGALYLPASLFPRSTMKIFVRSSVSAKSLAPALRSAIWSIEPQQPISDIETMPGLLSHTLSGPRFITLLFGIFGGLALLLASAGIFGIVSANVIRRRREIGIRMALGARAPQILRSTLCEGLALTSTGIVVGATAALILLPAIGTLLFDVRPLDPLSLAGAAVCLVTASVVATLVPARRAAQIDPMEALRSE